MSTGQLIPDQFASSIDYVDQYSTDVIYSDIDLRFSPHPVSSDISIVENHNAVKHALKYLILTMYGERPFNPNFGSAVANQLFEPVQVDYVTISESIRRTVLINEPRAKIEDIVINSNDPDLADSNTLNIAITFRVKNFKEINTLNITLKRNR